MAYDFHAVVRALTKTANGCQHLTNTEQDALALYESVEWQMNAACAAGDVDYIKRLSGVHRMDYDERRQYFIEKMTFSEQLKLFKAAADAQEPEFEDASFGF